MSQLRRSRRVLGLLALPLLFVAVVAITLAWAQTGPPDAYAASVTTFDPVAQDVGIAPLQDTGGVITDATIDGAVTKVTFDEDNGITDFSAIPIVGDGLSAIEITYLAITGIGAILLVTGTFFTGFDYVMRTRRRLDIPIASTSTINGVPIGWSKRFRTMMGRVAQAPFVAGGLQIAATCWTTATQWTKAITATAATRVRQATA